MESRPAPDVVATRKTVTIFFSDLTGSTALGERMDPESVRTLMAPVYAAMRNEVEARGGVVAKFVGDGVMAVFGVPDVREDDAMRALDAAFGMRQTIDRLSQDLPSALSLKVGVNTGEVVIGAGDEDIVGDCVNVAARLEGACAPGEILVGEETWRLTRASAAYEPVAPLSLKGKAQPVPAYRLVSLERTQEAGTSTFVGRDGELGGLLEAFEEAVRTNASRLVTIVGSPGLGKTRLTRELGLALSERALVVETRCDPASGATFAPVADALRSAADIDDSATPDEVVEAMKTLVPDDPECDRIAERAAALLGAGSAGTTEETFWAIRRIVETAAKTRPLVLVLDDLHWAEPLLLDLVEHLAEWNKTVPVLLVVTGRPELRDMRPHLTESAISLEGLDRGATEALACGLLGTDRVPSELLARLPESTEGNPLFVREFVRMLVDDGVLRRADDRWVATIDVDAIQIPPTIHSLLAARVDRLTPHERTVLELASVIGKEFYKGAIAALAPAAVKVDLNAHFESLRRKELVEPAGTYWIDEPVFRFHHALIQDAAYRRLLKESRADLHERVAEWLERKLGGIIGEHDELIGYHLEQAHESLRQLGSFDDHTGELGKRAGMLLASAARSALDRDDLPAAAALSGRALARLDASSEQGGDANGDPDEADVLLVRCESLLGTGDVTNAAPAVAQLERVAASSPRLKAWATCYSGELANLTDTSRLRDVERSVSAAAEEFASLGDHAGAAKAHTVHAGALARLGRFAECESALDRALNAAREAGDRRRVTAVLGAAPLAALWGPSPVSRAGGRCLDIIRLLRITTGSPAVEVTSQRCQAVLEAFRGRTDAARRMLAKARSEVEELGLRHGQLETEFFAGIVELTAGAPAAAESHLRAAFDGWTAMGVDVDAARAAAMLGRARLLQGDEEEAERLAARSERLGGDDLKSAIAWRGVRAEILARRGEGAEARRLAQEAVDVAARTDALFDHGAACMALAAVCRTSGDHSAAKRASDEAASLFERKGATALMPQQLDVATPVSVPAPADQLPHNAAYRAMLATVEPTMTADWDRLRQSYRADATWIDHRPTVRTAALGREEVLEGLRGAVEHAGLARLDMRITAMRGDRLALTEVTLKGPRDESSFEMPLLNLAEVDDLGVVRQVDLWEPESLSDALLALDERYIAMEPVEHREVMDVGVRFMRALSAGDWELSRSLLAEDVVQTDNRPASFGDTRGRDSVIDPIVAIADLADLHVFAVAVAAIRPGVNVAQVTSRRRTPDGSDLEITWWALTVVRDGVIQRLERFDSAEPALVRFDELGRESVASNAGTLENACVRRVRESTPIQESGDLVAYELLMADGYTWFDKRPGVTGGDVLTKAEAVENFRVMWELGATAIGWTALAIRGERLALFKVEVLSERDELWRVELLDVAEIDEEGRFVSDTVFEVSDLDAAFAELNERYIAGEGAAFDIVELMRGEQYLAARDWDRFKEFFTADLVVIDHRPASLGEMRGVDALIDSQKGLIALVPDFSLHTTSTVRMANEAAVLNLSTRGTSRDGGAVDLSFIIVAAMSGGRCSRIEYFPPEASAAAVARFEQIRATTPWETEALRWQRRFFAALRPFDPELVSGVLADDPQLKDHRRGLSNSAEGRDGFIEVARAMVEIGAVTATWSVVATRGDRLALTHTTFLRPSGVGWEVHVFYVIEVDDDGRLRSLSCYDFEDRRRAISDLDERWKASRDAPWFAATATEMVDALNQADWDRWAGGTTGDFVHVDHRPAALGELRGTRAFTDAVANLRAVIPDLFTYVSRVHDFDRDGFAVEFVNLGTSVDGNPVELAFHAVVQARGQKKVSRTEWFPIDRLDAALARFQQLGSDRTLANRCVRAVKEYERTFNQRDWGAMRALYRPDVRWVDVRAGLTIRLGTPDEILDAVRVLADVGFEEIRFEPIAIRGEGLALFSVTRLTEGDLVVEHVGLFQVDDDGLIAEHVNFDANDIDEALRELRKRYAQGEGEAFADVLGTGNLVAAYNARNWDRFRDVSEGYYVLDHRPASWGRIDDVDEYVDLLKGLVDLAPDVTLRDTAIYAIDRDHAVIRMEVTGTTHEGASVDAGQISVLGWRANRVAYQEIFPIDALDAALARFDALGARDMTEPQENAASRALRAVIARVAAGGDVVDLLAEDIEFVDKRTAMGDTRRGRDDVIAARVIAQGIPVDRELSLLATFGDRLAGLRVVERIGRSAQYEVESIVGIEVDEEHLISSIVAFDPDDIDGFFEEGSARAGRVLGIPQATASISLRIGSAINHGDWEAMRACLTDDFVLVDHRPASLGELGPDGYVEAVAELSSLFDDLRAIPVVMHRWSRDSSLSSVRVESLSADVEMSFHVVGSARADKLVRIEWFPAERFDDAVVRYEELAGAEQDELAHPEDRLLDGFNRYLAAFDAGDWEGVLSTLAPHVVFVDRRPASFGEVSGPREDLVGTLKAFADVSTQHHRVTAIHARAEDALVAEVLRFGTNDDGGPIESRYLHLSIGRDGLCERSERFEVEDLDVALARLRQLLTERAPAALSMPTGLDNGSARVAQRYAEAFNARDWTTLQRLFSNDVALIDDRSGLTRRAAGADEIVEANQILVELGFDRVRFEVRAIRGQRLSLHDVSRETANDFVVEHLLLLQVDERGLITRQQLFDPDDDDGAFRQLNDEFAAGEGAKYARMVRNTDLIDSYNARDWDRMRRSATQDFVAVDHRPASFGRANGIDQLIEIFQGLIELVPDVRQEVVDVLGMDEGLIVQRLRVWGHSPEGAEVELSNVAVGVAEPDGRVSRVEIYSFEQRDEALARFELLRHSAVETEEAPASSQVERLLSALAHALEAADWPAALRLLRDDVGVEDRRRGLALQATGPDVSIENLRQMRDLGLRLSAFNVLATRGPRIALVRGRMGDEATNVIDGLLVLETAEDGRIKTLVMFDPDDFDEAIAMLEDLYLAGEGAEHRSRREVERRALDAMNASDWDNYASFLAPDFVFVDHRPASVGVVDREGYLRFVRSIDEVQRGVRRWVEQIIEIRGPISITRIRQEGSTPDGAVIENAFYLVDDYQDGQTSRHEFFAADDLAGALARFEELTRVAAPELTAQRTHLENACTRLVETVDRLGRVGDWEAVARLAAPGAIVDDRRRGIAWKTKGRAEAVANMRSALEESYPDVRPLATRGENLALFENTWVRENGFEIRILIVHELDPNGLLSSATIFDHSEIDAAFAELDAAYLEGEGTAFAGTFRANRFIDAYNARDWAAFRSSVSDDFVLFDHRPASLGDVHGPDEMVAAYKPITELVPDARWRILEINAIDGESAVVSVVVSGHSVDGGEVELPTIGYVQRTPDGRVRRIDIFPTDDLEGALACFAAERTTQDATVATATLSRFFDAWLSGDREAVPGFLDPEIRWEDHRAGMSASYRGRDAAVEYLSTSEAVFGDLQIADLEFIATRGQNLALWRIVLAATDRSFEVEFYGVSEYGENGLCTRFDCFDPADFDQALAKLEERYLETLDAGRAAVWDTWRRAVAAHAARDWDLYATLLGEGMVFVDHRLASLGTLDAQELSAALRGMIELAPDLRSTATKIHEIDECGAIYDLKVFGTNADGGTIEQSTIGISEMRDGRIVRWEIFDERDRDEAQARFRELRIPSALVENAASRVASRGLQDAVAGDYESMRRMMRDDAAFDDRRKGVGSVLVGADKIIENARVIRDLGSIDASYETLATRGERVCIGRIYYRNAAIDFDADMIELSELDPSGRMIFTALFDPDDADDAFRELERRYLDGECAPFKDVWDPIVRVVAAYNSRDWVTLRSGFADDVVVTDHRLTSLGTMNGFDAFMESVEGLIGVVPDLRCRITGVGAIDVNNAMFDVVFSGTNTSGGDVELPACFIEVVKDGWIVRQEYFDLDDRAAAIRRFEELSDGPESETGPADEGDLPNRSARVADAFIDPFNRRDWDALAELYSPTLVFEDRRAGLSASYVGREAHVAQMQVMGDLGARARRAEAVATRGERLVLNRTTWIVETGAETLEVENLLLHEIDAGELTQTIVVFDPDDGDEAFRDLERRYLEGDCAPFKEVWTPIVGAIDAFNRRDWESWIATAAEDFESVDHRPAGWGATAPADGVIDRMLVDLVPDLKMRVLAVEAINDHGCMIHGRSTGTNSAGGEVEITSYVVLLVADGKVRRLEEFPLDSRTKALTRFEELTRESPGESAEALAKYHELASEPHETRATVAVQRFFAAWDRGDLDARDAFFRDDVVWEDHREMMSGTFVGREQAVGYMRTGDGVASGVRIRSLTFEATRGSSCALGTVEIDLRENGFLIEIVGVWEVDDAGRLIRFDCFDPDATDAAFAVLDERYIAGEGAPYREILEALARASDAHRRRDWDAYRALTAADFVYVDHRPASLGTLEGPDSLVESARTFFDVMPDASFRVVGMHRITAAAFLAETLVSGTTSEGGAVEISYLLIGMQSEGLAVRSEVFSTDQMGEALARFEELAADSSHG